MPGSALKTRNKARREGWPDPLWWEDMGHIDDPDFDPAAAVERELNRDELAALRRQEIAHLAAFGIPEHEIAQRLGMSPHYVHDLIRDRLSTAA
jgi:AraC-like DNA-binding protein